jgi:hypothetical protein
VLNEVAHSDSALAIDFDARRLVELTLLSVVTVQLEWLLRRFPSEGNTIRHNEFG